MKRMSYVAPVRSIYKIYSSNQCQCFEMGNNQSKSPKFIVFATFSLFYPAFLSITSPIDEFHIIDAILNCGANSENRGSDISLKLRRNIASNHLKFFCWLEEAFGLDCVYKKFRKNLSGPTRNLVFCIWSHLGAARLAL